MSDERNVPGRGPYLVVMSGLAVYATFETVAIAFAWLASRQWTEVVAKMMFVNQNLERTVLSDQAARKYDDLVGIFDALLAIGEVGLVVAFVTGLVWLHQAWTRAPGKKRSATANAVVGWCLVPILGYWKLFGFLLELARLNRLDQEKVKIGRWWWAVAVHMVLRCIASTVHQPGVVNIASCVVATLASLLGIRMIRLFQQTYEARARTPQPA